MVKATGMVALILTLAACQTGPGASQQGLILADTITVKAEMGPISVAPCYRTLARVDCHSKASPSQNYRRIGYFHGPAYD